MGVPSRYLQLALFAVLATNVVAVDSHPDVGEGASMATEVYYAGPEGYTHSTVIPSHLSVLTFMKTSKEDCQQQCDKDSKCEGFKYGGGGCSLMGVDEESESPTPAPALPSTHTTDAKVIAGKDLPGNKMQAAQATVYLASLAGKMPGRNELKGIAKAAAKKENELEKGELKPVPRSKAGVMKRGVQYLKLMKKYELEKNFYEIAKKDLPENTERKIKETLDKLPASARPGSQQDVADDIIKGEWKHFKNGFRREVGEEIKKDEGDDKELKHEVRKMIQDSDPDATMENIQAKEKASRDAWETEKTWRLTPQNVPGAVVGSTASEFADNLVNCPELKSMCKMDIRTRRQCPHTCRFVKEAKEKEEEKAMAAKKVLVQRREETAKDMEQQEQAKEDRLEQIKKEDAETKESETKMAIKAKELEAKLNEPHEKTEVKMTPDPEIEKAEKRDAQAKALRKLAMKLQNQGKRKIANGQKFIQSADADVEKQENATKMSKITEPIQLMNKANHSMMTVQPDVAGNLEKAKEESPIIANNLESAINLVKSGEDDLTRSKVLLKRAIAISKGLPPPQPAKKPLTEIPQKDGIPADEEKLRKLRKEMAEKEEQLKLTPASGPGSENRQGLVDRIKEIKKLINEDYKPMPQKIAEPNGFEDMSGAGRKAVEGGPMNKGEQFDPAAAKRKEEMQKAKESATNQTAAKDPAIVAAEADVKKAMEMKPRKPGSSRGHSEWKPKPRKKRRGKGKMQSAPQKGGTEVEMKKDKMGVYAKKSTKELLGDARNLHRILTTPERHINFDHDGCNYTPPNGCGCEGGMLTQQSQPRLGESAEVVALDAEQTDPPPVRPDPTSKGDCPEMPADCSCRISQAEVSMLQVSKGYGDLGADMMEEVEGMFTGIVCRIRTAIAVAKTKQPSLLAALKANKTYKDNKAEIAPLLSCVQDDKQSDKKCADYIPALMGVGGDLMPTVTKMQNKLGMDYQRAVKSDCKAEDDDDSSE